MEIEDVKVADDDELYELLENAAGGSSAPLFNDGDIVEVEVVDQGVQRKGDRISGNLRLSPIDNPAVRLWFWFGLPHKEDPESLKPRRLGFTRRVFSAFAEDGTLEVPRWRPDTADFELNGEEIPQEEGSKLLSKTNAKVVKLAQAFIEGDLSLIGKRCKAYLRKAEGDRYANVAGVQK